jgi:hypothetical protein
MRLRMMTALITAQLLAVGCGANQSSSIAPPTRHSVQQGSSRSAQVVVVSCQDLYCSNCNPLFQACEYCDPSDLDCPPLIIIGGPTGGGGTGSGSGTSSPGPSCPQVIDGPDGTFDGVHTNVQYTVPFSALTRWSMLSQNHVDQVNVEFYDGATYVGANAQGGSSISQSGLYTSTPPAYSPYSSTRMTGNWIDKDPAHQTPDTNLTFTATANSSC